MEIPGAGTSRQQVVAGRDELGDEQPFLFELGQDLPVVACRRDVHAAIRTLDRIHRPPFEKRDGVLLERLRIGLGVSGVAGQAQQLILDVSLGNGPLTSGDVDDKRSVAFAGRRDRVVSEDRPDHEQVHGHDPEEPAFRADLPDPPRSPVSAPGRSAQPIRYLLAQDSPRHETTREAYMPPR